MSNPERWERNDRENERNQRNHSNRKTGFPNLDAMQPLYPGLYVIGAIPSLGKTTFIHQMADQIAATKRPVLYFSFEQTANELYNKSLARVIHQQSKQQPGQREFTAKEIQMGAADGTPELDNALKDYTASVQNYMNIIECNFDCTVEVISNVAQKHIRAGAPYGLFPVVIIDYLQVVRPSTVNNAVITEQRASVDHIIISLKKLQMEYGLVVIVISNLNRMNYLLPVDYESFKESGGIEYTADVIWGMNLTLVSDPDFESKVTNLKTGTRKDRNLSEKRQLQARAKRTDVRDIELRVLKNRFGQTSDSLYFAYDPKHDYFEATTVMDYEKRKYRYIFNDDEEDET